MTLPLVAAQPGIWLADRLSPHHNAYIVSHYLELSGNLDVGVFCEAIMLGMAETDTLQMKFEEIDGDVVQYRTSEGLPLPEVFDARDMELNRTYVQQIMEQDMSSCIRLDSGRPLVRHVIVRLTDTEWIWYQRYHHIQVDAFSFTALTRRMVDLYTATKRGSLPITSPFKPINNVVDEYQQYLKSAKYQKDESYWKEVCATLPQPVSFKALNNAQPSKNIIRASIEFQLDEELAMALIATWLLRLSNTSSMGIGFIFMRRLGSKALHTAGPFINVLPMLIGIDPDTTLSTLASNISKTIKTMRKHQKFDSESISRELLYGPVINFKAFDFHLDFHEIECTTHHLASGPIRDIEIVLYVHDGKAKVEYLANADRYDEITLTNHLKRLPLLYEQFVSNPELPCSQANLLFHNEVKSVATHHIAESSLVVLLEKQARATPNAIALQDQVSQLTYREMQDQVREIARELKLLGVGSGDIVAVSLERSNKLAITLQAVLFAGAAYLPLDPSYPQERLNLMIEDAMPKVIVSETGLEQRISSESTSALLSDAAYIIYTSGSTGRPKGAVISHKAIVNRLMWMQSEYKLTDDDAVLQKTPSSFDVSVWEFFWPLITGARLVMAPPEAHRDPEQLRKLIADHDITTVHFVPSMLHLFVPYAQGVSLRRVFCSGEALSTNLARKWYKITGVPLYNLYGPTEAAIDVTSYPAFGKVLDEVDGTSVPIGYPVWNTGMHVLDHQLQPLPVGVAGDMFISGRQLAEGYLNRPELTADRFIMVNGKRMYRTGDVGRWLPNGALEFLGRSDDQIKLRGQRIELGEIDAALERLPGVKQAVCQPQSLTEGDEDSRQLIGYVVGNVDVNACIAQLADQLPAYMVPRIMVLPDLPIGVTGKVNRRALPKPSFNLNGNTHRELVGLEKPVAETFSELLGIQVSADDDFFSLGGHSLLAVRLAAQLRSKLGLPVTIGQIMQTPKVSSLAAKLDENDHESWRTAGFETILNLRVSSQAESRPIYCIHPASGFSWQFSVLRRYLDQRWSLVGIQSAKSGVLANSSTLHDVIENHFKIITEHSPGPYYLMGYSLGGTLAHALAARLESAGKTVAFLGLLDTWPPETQNWDGKKVDQAVIDEMQREREQFTAQQGLGSTELFNVIEGNYASAVRLLATARSASFKGTTTLFVAERTFPQGTDLQQIWRDYTGELRTIPVDSSHVDIISPTNFEKLGPQINELLREL